MSHDTTSNPPADYTDLNALFINTTLDKSPAKSHTQGVIDLSVHIMKEYGVTVDQFRAVDFAIAPGVYPDMREKGWSEDAWPELWQRVKKADILVIGGPIWLGDNSSETKKIIERLYAQSNDENDKGQYIFYGKVGGAIITGNEDGLKHCSSNVLYSLQHIGYSIPPAADAGWLGEIGPGPSYLDEGSGGLENDFTNSHVTTMTWNLLHLARMLKDAGGYPAYGNVPSAWNDGERFGFKQINAS